MTRTEYALVAAELNALWPASRWEVGTLKAGESLLLDLEPGPALAAVRALAAEGERFAPNPGQLRRKALELAGPRVPSADQALAEVHATIARIGHLGTPAWSHPAIGDTVAALGGWSALCGSTEPMADRAHFLRIYGTVERRYDSEMVMPPSVSALVAGVDLSLQRAIAGPS